MSDDLKLIKAFGEMLTATQLKILKQMNDNENDDYEGQIIYEKGMAYIGDNRISARSVNALLRACAISDVGELGATEIYIINETGKEILGEKGLL